MAKIESQLGDAWAILTGKPRLRYSVSLFLMKILGKQCRKRGKVPSSNRFRHFNYWPQMKKNPFSLWNSRSCTYSYKNPALCFRVRIPWQGLWQLTPGERHRAPRYPAWDSGGEEQGGPFQQPTAPGPPNTLHSRQAVMSKFTNSKQWIHLSVTSVTSVMPPM